MLDLSAGYFDLALCPVADCERGTLLAQYALRLDGRFRGLSSKMQRALIRQLWAHADLVAILLGGEEIGWLGLSSGSATERWHVYLAPRYRELSACVDLVRAIGVAWSEEGQAPSNLLSENTS